MDALEPYLSLFAAIGIGLVMGLEREQNATGKHGSPRSLGGVRTFPLVALLGALSSLLSRELGVWPLIFTLGGLLGFMIVAYASDLKKDGDHGITSEVAMVLTFLLGALALSRELIVPLSRKLIVISALGVGATTMLSFKEPLHGFVAKLSRDDIYATMKFLIITVIVLPLLPNENIGPLKAFNPFGAGLMVVLISGVGFLGYVAMRILGPGRGIGVTGVIGGLVSSTAVTLSMSRQAKDNPSGAVSCALAVTLASTVMFFRIIVVVAITNNSLLLPVLAPIGAMGLGGIIASAILYFKGRQEKSSTEDVTFVNPFALSSALKFALLFVLVLFASKAAMHYFGQGGSYAAGLLTGITDVDAITISMAKLAGEGLDFKVAATTILIAAVSNTIVKAVLATVLGGWRFGWRVALALGTTLVTGALGMLALWIWV